MRHNSNQPSTDYSPLMRHLTILLVIAIFISGCAGMQVPAAAPAGGAEQSRNNAGDAASGAAAPSSRDRDYAENEAAAPAAEESPRGGSTDSSADSSAATGRRETTTEGGSVEPPSRSDRYEPVTAGVVDDNEEWTDYLEYRSRRSYRTKVNDREVSERYWIVVQDSENLPVHDAEVTVYVDDDEVFMGRTDSAGRMLFHPQALDTMNGWGAQPHARVSGCGTEGLGGRTADVQPL